jgi:hypothetical protein
LAYAAVGLAVVGGVLVCCAYAVTEKLTPNNAVKITLYMSAPFLHFYFSKFDCAIAPVTVKANNEAINDFFFI